MEILYTFCIETPSIRLHKYGSFTTYMKFCIALYPTFLICMHCWTAQFSMRSPILQMKKPCASCIIWVSFFYCGGIIGSSHTCYFVSPCSGTLLMFSLYGIWGLEHLVNVSQDNLLCYVWQLVANLDLNVLLLLGDNDFFGGNYELQVWGEMFLFYCLVGFDNEKSLYCLRWNLAGCWCFFI